MTEKREQCQKSQFVTARTGRTSDGVEPHIVRTEARAAEEEKLELIFPHSDLLERNIQRRERRIAGIVLLDTVVILGEFCVLQCDGGEIGERTIEFGPVLAPAERSSGGERVFVELRIGCRLRPAKREGFPRDGAESWRRPRGNARRRGAVEGGIHPRPIGCTQLAKKTVRKQPSTNAFLLILISDSLGKIASFLDNFPRPSPHQRPPLLSQRSQYLASSLRTQEIQQDSPLRNRPDERRSVEEVGVARSRVQPEVVECREEAEGVEHEGDEEEWSREI